MVAPTAFMKNEAASLDNYFMNDAPASVELTAEETAELARREKLQRKVLEEFSELHRYSPARRNRGRVVRQGLKYWPFRTVHLGM